MLQFENHLKRHSAQSRRGGRKSGAGASARLRSSGRGGTPPNTAAESLTPRCFTQEEVQLDQVLLEEEVRAEPCLWCSVCVQCCMDLIYRVDTIIKT